MESEFQSRLERVIPGGTHTYSKGVDQYPINAPKILTHGNGPNVFNSKGDKYLDYGMGLKSVLLGYNFPEVTNAVVQSIKLGNNLSKPSLLELEAAEKFVQLFPNVDMVKFAKNGSNVTTAAIKLARASNGKKYVCVPRQQPFFSFDDWFIGSTEVKKGVPDLHSSLTLQFDYNDISSLKSLFERYPGEISAVILEPASQLLPCSVNCASELIDLRDCATCPDNKSNFLKQTRQLCDSQGVVLIFDEMRTGFRWHLLGAQEIFQVKPDLSTFGKAMANGFSIAALAGKKEIMQLGNTNLPGAERTFLLSSTFGAEMSSLAAFLATTKVCEDYNVSTYLWDFGKKLKDEINNISKEMGISQFVYTIGSAINFEIVCKDQNFDESMGFKTLFLQEMVQNSVLFTTISPSFSHKEAEFQITIKALKNSLKIYSMALIHGLGKYLKGPEIKPVFRRFN